MNTTDRGYVKRMLPMGLK